MDVNKAVQLLKKALDDMNHLRTLHLGDQQFELWHNKVLDILEVAFGRNSSEYVRFTRAVSVLFPTYTKADQQKEYNRRLDEYETALKSILQKYEILGIEEEPLPIGKENGKQGVMMNNIQPAAFIVHGGRSGVLDKLREFVEALGIKPLIVEMLPSKGMTLADKVKKYQQEADCAIILATRGGIIDTKSGKQHPRLNVIDELSSFWEAFPERVIVLLEKGAELPSNKSGLTYEPFARQSMDRAFIAIARELTEMKILKAVKPSQEQTL